MMVAHGRVALRRREGMVPFYANDATNTEHVQRVLGHNKFLVKGFSEGIFVREGYIVVRQAKLDTTSEMKGVHSD